MLSQSVCECVCTTARMKEWERERRERERVRVRVLKKRPKETKRSAEPASKQASKQAARNALIIKFQSGTRRATPTQLNTASLYIAPPPFRFLGNERLLRTFFCNTFFPSSTTCLQSEKKRYTVHRIRLRCCFRLGPSIQAATFSTDISRAVRRFWYDEVKKKEKERRE